MGFGLLFIGYLSLLFFKVLPPAMLVGQYLACRGLKKLTAYESAFRPAYLLSFALSVYFAVYTAFWIAAIAGFFDIRASLFILIDDIIYKLLLIAWHILLLRAFETICTTVGYDGGVKRSRLCRVFLITYIFVWVLRVVTSFFYANPYFTLAELIFLLGFLIMTAALIYSCYMRIATPSIIEEETRKMREYDEKYSFRTKKKK